MENLEALRGEGNMRGFWKFLLTPLSSEERKKNVFTRLEVLKVDAIPDV